MNTDNLSLLGITVDLTLVAIALSCAELRNVYGFLSKYDLSWAPNHIDETARPGQASMWERWPRPRYAFGAQPEIAKWNLQRRGVWRSMRSVTYNLHNS